MKYFILFAVFFYLLACSENTSSRNNPLTSIELPSEGEGDFIPSSNSEDQTKLPSSMLSSSSAKHEGSSSSTFSSSSAKHDDSSSSTFSSSSAKHDDSSSSTLSSSSAKHDDSSSSTLSSSSAKHDDSSSSTFSSSSAKYEDSSSSTLSSSSAKHEGSSSSMFSSSSSILGIPSKKYDCNEYDCITTKYLNPIIDYDEFLDIRDNQVYRTVQIGNQVWMAQNLNYAAGGSFCYRDSVERCQIEGRLYTWEVAKESCPKGWHLPDSTEYNDLLLYVEKHKPDGSSMQKSLVSIKHSGKDFFGFCALLGSGYKDLFWNAYDEGAWGYGNTYIWTASESTKANYPADTYAKIRYFSMSYPESFAKGTWKKADALSVRCIRD